MKYNYLFFFFFTLNLNCAIFSDIYKEIFPAPLHSDVWTIRSMYVFSSSELIRV